MALVSEKFKKRVFDTIEMSKDKDSASSAYDMLMTVSVIVGLIPLTLKAENRYTILIDLITSAIFLFDYLIRLWTSDYKMGYKSYKSLLWYIQSPMAIIDFLSILPVINVFIPQTKFTASLRIVRIFRMFKLIRYSKTMVLITNVLRKVKSQLLAVLILTSLYICASAMLMFQVEPDSFNTFFDALYWATMAITTIGYGDIVPTTELGRFINIISALVGVAVIALPSGIITAAYMDEIKKKKTKLQL